MDYTSQLIIDPNSRQLLSHDQLTAHLSHFPFLNQLLKTAQPIWLEPDFDSKAATKTIKIEQVRQLQQQLATANQTTRIVLIYPADNLTPPAQQSLLKILEEPIANTQIVLIASRQQALLPTIISRCQIWSFPNSSKTTGNLANLLHDSFAKKVEFISKNSSKTQAQSVLTELLQTPPTNPLELQAHYAALQALEALQVNVNPQLCLEHTFLAPI